MFCGRWVILSVSTFAQLPNEPVLKSYGALVYPPIARATRVARTITVEFTIDARGETGAVGAIEGPPMLRKSAEEFVKSWIFDARQGGIGAEDRYTATIDFKAIEGAVDPRPDQNPKIESNGFHHFVMTVVVSDIELSDCPMGADEDVPLATGQDDYVEVSRSSCMGSCPRYMVRVNADGIVSWKGDGSVAAIGHRNSTIDPNMLAT